jgi:hypothetical protein
VVFQPSCRTGDRPPPVSGPAQHPKQVGERLSTYEYTRDRWPETCRRRGLARRRPAERRDGAKQKVGAFFTAVVRREWVIYLLDRLQADSNRT